MRIAAMLTTLAAAMLTASAAAGGAASDPLRTVLQRSDFPAKTRWTGSRDAALETSLAKAGIEGRAASYLTHIPRGGTEELLVSGLVIRLPSIAEARRVFGSYRNPFPAPPRDVVRLPVAYGDEQVAIATGDPARADLRVRKGAVVWRLEIKWAGTDEFTRARALAELRTYAAKQKRRVAR
jgi:hypothetical protein